MNGYGSVIVDGVKEEHICPEGHVADYVAYYKYKDGEIRPEVYCSVCTSVYAAIVTIKEKVKKDKAMKKTKESISMLIFRVVCLIVGLLVAGKLIYEIVSKAIVDALL